MTLVEGAGRIMLQDEPEAADVVAQRLSEDGVDLRIGAAVERVGKTSNGVRLVLGGGSQVGADTALVAVGWRPPVDGLGLAETKIAHGRGGIEVNRYLRTNQKSIYAAGDRTGGYQFIHYASYQGFMAVRNAFLPFNKRSVLEPVPWATFTDP